MFRKRKKLFPEKVSDFVNPLPCVIVAITPPPLCDCRTSSGFRIKMLMKRTIFLAAVRVVRRGAQKFLGWRVSGACGGGRNWCAIRTSAALAAEGDEIRHLHEGVGKGKPLTCNLGSYVLRIRYEGLAPARLSMVQLQVFSPPLDMALENRLSRN